MNNAPHVSPKHFFTVQGVQKCEESREILTYNDANVIEFVFRVHIDDVELELLKLLKEIVNFNLRTEVGRKLVHDHLSLSHELPVTMSLIVGQLT